MKNRWKHIFIPVPAMALCLSLAACGNSDDVAGDDWRTTGVVVGSGTIAHDGESVDAVSYTHLIRRGKTSPGTKMFIRFKNPHISTDF